MSITQVIQKQIKEIEDRIKTDSGDVADLKKALARLKMQEFEEDIKEKNAEKKEISDQIQRKHHHFSGSLCGGGQRRTSCRRAA